MHTVSFQFDLDLKITLVDGLRRYGDQHAFFLRLDASLPCSGLEREFIDLSIAHRQIDLSQHRTASFDPGNHRVAAEVSRRTCNLSADTQKN